MYAADSVFYPTGLLVTLDFYKDLSLSFLPWHPIFVPWLGILVATLKIWITRKQNSEAILHGFNPKLPLYILTYYVHMT